MVRIGCEFLAAMGSKVAICTFIDVVVFTVQRADFCRVENEGANAVNTSYVQQLKTMNTVEWIHGYAS
jgi:hypothetical protein